MNNYTPLENSFLNQNYLRSPQNCSVSHLDSSMLSSTCGEATILESLKKIQELKSIYHQTIAERKILVQHSQKLSKQMILGKKNLEVLIQTSFLKQQKKDRHQLSEQMIESPTKVNKVSRHGSIGKIVSPRKMLQMRQESRKQIEVQRDQDLGLNLKQNEFVQIALSPRLQFDGAGLQTRKTHKKIISNLEFSVCHLAKQGTIKTQKKLNKGSARKSTEMIRCQNEVGKIWGEQTNIVNNNKKSYLSPRNSFLKNLSHYAM